MATVLLWWMLSRVIANHMSAVAVVVTCVVIAIGMTAFAIILHFTAVGT